MKKFFKPKNIIAIVGILISIILTGVFSMFGESGALTEISVVAVISRFAIAICISAILGFILLIFFGWKGFWLIFGTLTSFSVVTLVLNYTVDKAPGVALLLLAVGMFSFLCVSFYFSYKKTRDAINGEERKSNKQLKKEQQIEIEIQKLMEQDEKLKEEILYLEKSIIVSQMSSIYQVIKTDEYFYFHRLGNIFNHDMNKCVKDFSNLDELLLNNKKDYKISRLNIQETKAVLKENIYDFGMLTIKVCNKTKRYNFINQISENELNKFFDNRIEIKLKKVEEGNPLAELLESEKTTLNKFNLGCLIFSIISLVFTTIYLFFDVKVFGSKWLSILCLVCAIIPWICYVVFNKYLEMRDYGKFQTLRGDKIPIAYPCLIITIVLLAKLMLDFDKIVVYNYLKMLLISLVVFVILLFIVFRFTEEYKTCKSAKWIIVFILIFLSPSVVMITNHACDFSKPTEVACVITNMPTHTDNTGEVTYYITINYKGKAQKEEVSEKVYNRYKVGDEVVVVVYKGFLRIEMVKFKGL